MSGLRDAVRWTWSHAGSSWLLLGLTLVLGMWLVPFQLTGQPAATTDAIAWNWWPVRLLYVLIAVSTIVCTWLRARRDVRRAVRPLAHPPTPSAASEPCEDLSSEAAETTLGSRGYAVAGFDGGFAAVKNRWSTLGGTAFHIALLLFAGAIVLQHLYGSSAELRVTEGQAFADVAASEADWARNAVSGLSLEEVRPSYFEDVLLFTRLDAVLSTLDGRAATMSLAEPRWLDPSTHLSIQDYGLAPHMRVTEASGESVDDVVAAMNIFPPGAEDSVHLPGSGVEVFVVAYPDYGVVDGRDVSLSYNLASPAFRVSVVSMRDGAMLGRGLVKVGEPLDIGGRTLTIDDVSRYGTFTAYRSPGLPLALVAGVIALLGLLVRFGVPRHDVVVWEVAGGGIAVDAWLDGFGRVEGRRRAVRILRGERA